MKKILLILALVVSYCSGYAQETIEIDKKIELAKSKLKKDNNLEYNKSQVLAILDSLKIDIKNQDSIYRAEIDSLKEMNKSLSSQLEVYNILNDESVFEPKNIEKLEALNTAKLKVVIDIINLKGSIDKIISKIKELEKIYDITDKTVIYNSLKTDIDRLDPVFDQITQNINLISDEQKAWYDKNVRETYNIKILEYLDL